jgi:hypothetical protein
MTGSRRANTGGGPYGGRETVTFNSSRHQYGSTADDAGSTPAAATVGSSPREAAATVGSSPREATATVGLSPREATATHVFATARRHIDVIGATDPNTAHQLYGSVARVEAEVARGEAAAEAVIVHELRTIAGLTPELAAAVAAGLVDPTVGTAMPVRAAVARAVNAAV